jgi:drug/metabolite transporter (DMT)-like permease
VAAFIGVVLIGGANGVAVKQTVTELAPLWGAGLRFLVAAILMAGVVLILRRGWPRGRSLWGAALYGLVGFSAAYGLAYAGIREVPAGTAMVLISLTPLFTFGLSIIQGQERFHWQGLLGAVIAVGGVAVVFADQLGAAVPILSLTLMLLATLAIAEAGIVVKWVPRSDPFATNAVAMLVGSVVLLAVSLVLGESWTLPVETPTWVALGYLMTLGSVVLFSLYVFALQRWTASAVSYTTLLMPIVAIALAALVFGDPITPPFVLGAALILAGVYIGAFLRRPAPQAPATSLPECLPADAAAGSAKQPEPERA